MLVTASVELLRGTGGAHEAARSRSNNRSVMPFDALGRTRATLKEATRSLRFGGQARSSARSRSARAGQPLKLLLALVALRGWDWGLKLCPTNQEFPVSASQQLALITSLPFVHTARRYYRSNDVVRLLDRSGAGAWWPACLPAGRCVPREDGRTGSLRGSKSRNKVFVGEPAEGSLPDLCGFLNRGHPWRLVMCLCRAQLEVACMVCCRLLMLPACLAAFCVRTRQWWALALVA